MSGTDFLLLVFIFRLTVSRLLLLKTFFSQEGFDFVFVFILFPFDRLVDPVSFLRCLIALCVLSSAASTGETNSTFSGLFDCSAERILLLPPFWLFLFFSEILLKKCIHTFGSGTYNLEWFIVGFALFVCLI